MHELTLSPREIQEITGYKRYTRQQEQLRCHGIPFTTGPRNEPIVLRRDLQSGIQQMPKMNEYFASEPDYGALSNGQTT
ncbi:DUF4224 domain-containing protein [Cronobacter sakazakii]